jgi:hypothetical protein
MKRALCFGLLLFACVFAGVKSTLAQGQMPTGEGIARSARTATLNPSVFTTIKSNDQKITVAPIDFSIIKTSKDLERGRVVGTVDVSGIPSLPDGQYHVFIVKTNARWRAFFESDGKIVKEGKRVIVSSTTKPSERRVNVQPVAVIEVNLSVHICLYDEWICVYLD